jgi:hypothetical protein
VSDNQQLVALPESLREQFSGLKLRLWKGETLSAGSLALSALLFSCLALFISDRLWETPVWLRVTWTAMGCSGLAWFGFTWLRLWVIHPRDQRALAILVQHRYRRLGDRLLGIVELADEKQRPAYFSPALYRAAIEQVAAEARQFDFRGAVDLQPARRAVWVAALAVFLAILPVALSPAASLNAFQRWAAPAAPIERFTLVDLAGLPKEQVVPHGEAFDVTCSIRYRSIWRPRRVVCQFELQPAILATAYQRQVHVHLPGQVANGNLKLRVGDARAQVRIAPTYRPSLQELAAAVQFPAYLQYSNSAERVESGSLKVLEGSRVAFQGKGTRPLAAAQMQAAGQEARALRVDSETFDSEPMELDGVSDVAFTWRDRLGLTSAAPWRLQIQAQKDSPPTPELADLLKDTALLFSEVLDVKTIGRDDYGVREIGFDWQPMNDLATTNSPSNAHSFNRQASTPREKKLEETFHFSPGLLMIPPDSVVELRGFASDYYPDRAPSQTPVYRVHVLGLEQHAEMVRQSLESLLTRLEEVTRLEEKVSNSTKEVRDLPKEKLNADDSTERIAAAKEDQNQNAASLDQLANEGTKTLREAFRNPSFSEQTLADWTKNLKAMQQLAQGKMQQAGQALKTAQQNEAERQENLSQAAQKEQEILDELEQIQRQVNKGLDQLQALTLAQRLRKISSDEKEVAGRLQKIVPETIGMFPRELSERFRNIEASLAGDQETAQKETQVLQGEIGRFFERTQQENYGQVNKEMNQEHVTDELDRVRGLIEENISMDAVQNLGSWSERLKTWADLLEPKSDDAGSAGGGGEGGAADEALLKELLGLLRVRDREVNLRQRTGLLEKQKAVPEPYQEGAKALASAQSQVREEMSKIQGENPVPALEFPLQDVVDSMQQVQGLLDKPQTDRETDQAQTKSIQLLSDAINLINEQQQHSKNNSSSQSASAEEMAFLMQMMALQNNLSQGMAMNPKGGGSLAGGTTDRAAMPVFGDPNASPGDARTVNRASGSTANLPTEFREALENYFHGLENLDRK